MSLRSHNTVGAASRKLTGSMRKMVVAREFIHLNTFHGV